jgi:hypothetical protein
VHISYAVTAIHPGERAQQRLYQAHSTIFFGLIRNQFAAPVKGIPQQCGRNALAFVRCIRKCCVAVGQSD